MTVGRRIQIPGRSRRRPSPTIAGTCGIYTATSRVTAVIRNTIILVRTSYRICFLHRHRLQKRLDLALGVTRAGVVALGDVALLVDDELGGKVPRHVPREFLLEELPHRVSVTAVDVNLVHHVHPGTLETELIGGEGFDLGVRAGLLATELVAREANDLFVQCVGIYIWELGG